MMQGNLGQVVRMAAPQHFLEMSQIRHHGDDVVLDVGEVEADVSPGGDGVGLVALLRKTPNHIRFAAQQANQRHDFLATLADLLEDGAGVLEAGGEDGVLDGVGLALEEAQDGGEGVDDFVDEGVADPVGGEVDVVAQAADALAYVGRVGILAEGEGQQAFAEDDGVDVDGFQVVLAFFVDVVEAAEAEEVVAAEELDFFPRFLRCDVFAGEGVDAEGAADGEDFFFRRVEHVEPPDAAFGAEFEDVSEGFVGHEKAA